MALAKRSLSIHGHRTSVLLEPVFWAQLEEIAGRKALSLPALIAHIDRQRVGSIAGTGDLRNSDDASETAYKPPKSLASTLRVYVVNDLLARL